MDADDRKVLRGIRRQQAKEDGSLTHFRAVRFKNRKKEADRKACRGRVT